MTEQQKISKLAKARAWKAAHPERVKELNKRANEKRVSTPELREKKLNQCRKSNRKWYAANPNYDKNRPKQKVNARAMVRYRIWRGTLKRQPCEVCGETAQAHHDDYSKPLEVKWLCPKHHTQIHK